jgi:hypothetical protein
MNSKKRQVASSAPNSAIGHSLAAYRNAHDSEGALSRWRWVGSERRWLDAVVSGVAAVARFEGEDAFARCFTLDRIPELDPSAAVLEWDVDGNRKLHRDGCPPTREAFLDAVEEIVAPRGS